MQKIATVFTILILLVSCKKEITSNKNYAQLSGKITNAQDSILTLSSQTSQKTLTLNDDGTFSDTLVAKEEFYMLTHGDTRTFLNLKNGYNLDFNFDANDLINSIKFSGLGAGTNNYMAEKMKLENEFNLSNPGSFFELEKEEFDKKLNAVTTKMESLLDNAQDLDSTFTAMEKDGNSRFIEYLTTNYDAQHAILAPIAKGKPSPTFKYPNTKGELISLEDFKGKYVYVDVWATWCAPCIQQIPALKQLHKDYEGKNLEIVSLSIDKMEDKEKWKNMVAEKNLTGTQIMADNEWHSDFVKSYGITGIPRFILIDPEGNIVDNNAPRPTDPALRTLLSELEL
ncbi:TlpA family protein disulfide reductase [Aureibaculum marinum]|uniref:TlpA family protein disulfide reductase n=1 Tax=Aureibaculum marinum TaxID=2487930 RepID=A0A3N4NN93_9FLAO|nr:TlpA disulfide reductase family protein [Aureibaculum marinum]RPD93039.1 TlpA family protein disulfide reductase [Aureibaculum marinum]